MKTGILPRQVAALLSVLLLCAAAFAPRPALAQASDPAALEELVGPIALYPDDLLSITLQGSTYPLQIVEADRWIAANKGKKDAKPKDTWDDSVKALINYPDVVSKMSAELDWTTALGEAVATDQGAVMDAVQAFRRRADGAGNLKTDEKQVVEVDETVIKIVQADPQVIYVPQYEPTTVIVQQSTPYYPTYYPTPYPVYYYPYPPGYAYASGFFWGAAVGAAFDWHGGGIHDVDIDIDRNTNINSNRSSSNRATNIDRGKSQQMRQQGNTGWRSNASASDVGRGRATQTGSRPATANRAGTGQGAANRAGTTGQGAANRAGTGQAGANRASSGQAAANRGGSAGGYSRPSGGGASAASSNRSSSGGTGRYQNAGSYGQSARSSSPSRSSYSGGSSARSSEAFSSRGASSRGGGGGASRGGGGGGRRR
jgi:hypothetical protein